MIQLYGCYGNELGWQKSKMFTPCLGYSKCSINDDEDDDDNNNNKLII